MGDRLSKLSPERSAEERATKAEGSCPQPEEESYPRRSPIEDDDTYSARPGRSNLGQITEVPEPSFSEEGGNMEGKSQLSQSRRYSRIKTAPRIKDSDPVYDPPQRLYLGHSRYSRLRYQPTLASLANGSYSMHYIAKEVREAIVKIAASLDPVRPYTSAAVDQSEYKELLPDVEDLVAGVNLLAKRLKKTIASNTVSNVKNYEKRPPIQPYYTQSYLNVTHEQCLRCGKKGHKAFKGLVKCPLGMIPLTSRCTLCNTGGHIVAHCPTNVKYGIKRPTFHIPAKSVQKISSKNKTMIKSSVDTPKRKMKRKATKLSLRLIDHPQINRGNSREKENVK